MVEQKSDVNLDSILREIGQFGKKQIFHITLVMIAVIFSAVLFCDYIFVAKDLPYRCFVPECEDNIENSTYQMEWLDMAIPQGAKCVRYAILSIEVNIDKMISNSCSAEIFDRSKTIPCDGYVFGATNSLIYDFNIPCQEWKPSLIGTVTQIGYLITLPITGLMSDKFGRKNTLAVTAFNTGLGLVVRSYSTSYEMFVIITFITNVIGAGAYTCCYIIVTEMISKEYRQNMAAVISIAFSLGQILLALVAWMIQDWRTYSRVLSYPQLLFIFYFFMLNESIRWLLSNKKIKQAKRLLEKAASSNKRTLSNSSLECLTSSTMSLEETDVKNIKIMKLTNQVIKSKILLKRVCIIPFWWISVTFIYYGLSINSVGLSGNEYINYILVAAVEIPGFIAGLYGMKLLGRKKTLCGSFLICAVSNLAIPFLLEEYPWIKLLIYLIGKLFISVAVMTVYMFTMELYPTQTRNSLLAFSSMIGRLGSIFSPQTPLLSLYWTPLPNVMFGIMALISAGTVLTMPETLGTTLPDTIAEAENIQK